MPILSRNEIEAELGSCDEVDPVGSPSGSGECWRVVRGSKVQALKAIVKNPEQDRFEREVEAMARVDSPRVAKVEGRGEITAADGNTYPYLLSEFIDGVDVRNKLNSDGAPGDDELRPLLVGVLEGVVELHNHQIIHRDLKPENLMLRGGAWDDPVIIDLGLSRLVDLTTLTVYPWAGGTWQYMAPEQLAGERALDRTDLWGLAVVAGELAAGQHPFWHGEPSPPPDWDARLQGGIGIPGSRPAGLRDWIAEAGHYAAYRRPTAAEALNLLSTAWPP